MDRTHFQRFPCAPPKYRFQERTMERLIIAVVKTNFLSCSYFDINLIPDMSLIFLRKVTKNNALLGRDFGVCALVFVHILFRKQAASNECRRGTDLHASRRRRGLPKLNSSGRRATRKRQFLGRNIAGRVVALKFVCK